MTLLRALKSRRDEIALLLISGAYFVLLTTPFLTWVNTGCDGAVYLRSAKYSVVSHAWGKPLFNMLNWAIVRIPLGDEAWRLAMVSAVAAIITTLFLYKVAKRLTGGHWVALLAPAVWMASTLVVSQSTIIETYSLVTMLGVLVFYLHETGHDSWKYRFLLSSDGISPGVRNALTFLAQNRLHPLSSVGSRRWSAALASFKESVRAVIVISQDGDLQFWLPKQTQRGRRNHRQQVMSNRVFNVPQNGVPKMLRYERQNRNECCWIDIPESEFDYVAN